MAFLDFLLRRKKHLRSRSRLETDRSLDGFCQRIEPAADWDDLILPDKQRHVLRQLCAHVRQQPGLHGQRQFFGKRTRNEAASALFVGGSDSERRIAAEVLARDLQLGLYRVDLGAIARKYIGETEKNLERVFQAAEDASAILLFDEADALFDKRSEVRDAHDRYANVEVGYLLERVERLNGVAIFAASERDDLDAALLRQLHYIVEFTRPDSDGT